MVASVSSKGLELASHRYAARGRNRAPSRCRRSVGQRWVKRIRFGEGAQQTSGKGVALSKEDTVHLKEAARLVVGKNWEQCRQLKASVPHRKREVQQEGLASIEFDE